VDKIYSRKRIKLPNAKLPNSKNFIHNRKAKKIFYFITLWVIAVYTAYSIINFITPAFEKLCIEETKKIGTLILNDISTQVLKDNDYEDLVIVSKDSNDKITMVKSNVILINILASDIAYKVQQELSQLGKQDIKIALGVLTGIKLLGATGPTIPIQVKPVGSVETNFRSEFVASRY